MSFQFRKRLTFGPLRINISRSGVSTSYSVDGVTYSPRQRRLRVNLPGPFFWSTKLGRKGRPR